LGKISYGVYVYHLLLYGVFQRLTGLMAPHASPLEAGILLAAVGTCGTLLIASISFYTFERAFLSLKEKLAGPGNGAAKMREAPVPVLSQVQ
jgi:peptidoglycan/LPS O-acetylase OafA/YrhL